MATGGRNSNPQPEGKVEAEVSVRGKLKAGCVVEEEGDEIERLEIVFERRPWEGVVWLWMVWWIARWMRGGYGEVWGW